SRSTRMYGREKSAVVNATNAVSATSSTLSGSTKNCWLRTRIGPTATISIVSAAAAPKVTRLKPAFNSGALSRCPSSASTTPPTKGTPSVSRSGSTSVFLQLLEVTDVEAVELLADLEHEHAQDHHADQHVERDAEFDHHRHAIGGAGR